MSIRHSKIVPIQVHDKDEKTSNMHPYPRNPALPAADIFVPALAILEQRSEQQQDSKTFAYIKPEATGRLGWAERDFPFTPKTLRPSLVAPVLVSPAVSDASQDSFNDGDRFWDTPLWDDEDHSGMGNIDTLTPLTPPSSINRAKAEKFAGAESPLLQKTRRQKQFILDPVLKSELHNESVKYDAEAADDDYFSFPQQKIFRVSTLLERINKCQPQKRLPNKPDTDFSQPHKIVFEERSLEPAIIKKSGGSNIAFEAIMKSKQSSTINVEEAPNTNGSPARFTTSVVVETKTAVSRRIDPHIFPFEIHTRLKSSASLCVAFTKGGERCGRQAQGSELVHGSLKVLKTHYNHRDYKAFLAELKTFIHQALCGRSHRKPATDRIETFESTIRRDLAKEGCRKALMDLFGVEDATAFCLWANAISDLQDPQTQQVSVDNHTIGIESSPISNTIITETESHVALSTGPTATSVLLTTKISAVTLPWFSGFHPYRLKTTKILPPSVALRQAVEANLTETDLKSGFIYIFWLKGMSFGHLKIGRSNDPLRRLRQWNSQCRHEHVFVEDMIKVPHVSRVERLMHLELKDIRKSMKCAGCKKEHREWFEISESDARRVLTKWQDWIKQHPYEKDHTGNWTLKPSSREMIADICQPLLLSAKPLEALGPKKHNSPPVKLMGSKKYKSPRRKVSKARSRETSASRGRITSGKDDGLPEYELPSNGFIPDDKLHYSESVTLRTSNEPSKSDILGFTSTQATSSLPPRGGSDDTQSIVAGTTCKDSSSKRIDNHTTENQLRVNASIALAEAENIEGETTSAIINISVVETSSKLWYQRLSEMKETISQGKGKCVAYTKRKKRCSSKAPGSQHEINGLLNAWSKCLDDENYTAIPAIVKKFFECAVCGKQKFATTSLLKKVESLDKLATGGDYDMFAYALAATDFLNTKSALWHVPVSNHR